MTRLQYLIALGALLVAALLAGRRTWIAVASPRSPLRCDHPFLVRWQGRDLMVCRRGPRVAVESLLRRLGICRHGGGRTRVSSATVVIASAAGDRCLVRARPMNGDERLLCGLRIDPNLASASDLRALPRIGPVLSRRIVAHRRAHGAFERIEDLRRVKGIGPVTLRRLRPYLAVRSAR